MKKVELILSVLLVTVGVACGQGNSIPAPTQNAVDLPDTNMYIEHVISLLPYEAPFRLPRVALVKDLTFNNGGVQSPAVGLCRRLESGQPIEILLDEDFWNNTHETARLGLLAHEMLHCMYGLDHTDGGLMDPYIGGTVAAINEHGIEEAIHKALD